MTEEQQLRGNIGKASAVKPTGINQVYQAGFTKLPIVGHGTQFVLSVLDCFSRYVLVLRVSAAAETHDLIDGLDHALMEAQRVSEFSNDGAITLVTDGGPIFRSPEFRQYISQTPFSHVPNTARPFRSLGMVRRLAWTLQDEEFNLHEYPDPIESQLSLERFRYTYNFVRPHQALRYRVPAALYCNKQLRNQQSSSAAVQ
jgi:putative transposase